MGNRNKVLWLRYGFAVLSIVVASGLRLLLDPILGDKFVFTTLFFAVMVAAWLGGFGPAVFASLLGAASAAALLLPPRGSFAVHGFDNQVGLLLYFSGSFGIALLSGSMREAQRRAEDNAHERSRAEEGLRVTLQSIGDGVICTDAAERVTFLNPVAAQLTGWREDEGRGRSLLEVFTIVNESSRLPVENPAWRALKEGVVVGLANHTVLMARDGTERPIDDSAAPIRSKSGEVIGCVLVFRDITERHRAETENREAQQQLATTLESITDGFMRLDREWRLVYVNAEAERINQLSHSESLGKTLWELFPAVVGTILEAEFRRAVTEQVTVEFENHYEPWDRWYALKGYPTPGGGLTVYMRDITDRKRAEGDLARLAAESERQRRLYEAVLTNTPDFAYVFDLNHRFTYANDALLKTWGRTWDEAIGKNCLELGYEPWHAAMHDREIEQVVASKQPIRGEVSFTGTSGPRQYDYTFVPVIGLNGEVEAVAGTTRDVTELKQSEEQFRVLAESIPQLAWTAKPDGHIFWYNRRWYDYTGSTFQQMEGWGWQSVHDSAELPKVLERWKASIAAGKRFDMVFPLKGKDGVFRPFLTRIEPVKDEEGRVLQWVGTNTDISDEKRAEEELRRLTDELSEADQRKDEFLATLAHELRNPLAPIRNGLELIRLTGSDATTVEEARMMMERQLNQMVRLVDDLMDISRISQGKIELRKERLPLTAVLASAIETSRPLIEEMGHELTVLLPKQRVVIEADLTRLAQVFMNLLNNAAKYSERGGHIWLTAERHENDVTVSVKDTGIGLAADQLPRVFEMFSQVEHSLARSQGGLGIGLSLAKQLVGMHCGRIEAHSDGQGKGSEFVVHLPIVLHASEALPAGGNEKPVAAKSSLRILIVDDNRDGANSLAMMLRVMGNEIRTAYDGEEAVSATVDFQPDVILLDIGLPKLNGYEACRRIREQSDGRRVLIIAQTGWGQEEDHQRSQEAGFDHHLVKPVDARTLTTLLSELSELN